MAVTNSIGTYHHQSTGFEGRGRPEVKFDDNVPAGTDPMALWRLQNSQKSRRIGSTAAERAGGVAGYTPGYGRASAQNSNGASSLTPRADWDAHFQPHLGEQMRIAREGVNSTPPTDAVAPPATPPVTPGTGIPSPGPALPPAATPPALPPSPGIAQYQLPPNVEGTPGVAREITGLPQGQSASATFVRGQNTPANLAKRTRPPVDPYA